jgi:hypothetical protein
MASVILVAAVASLVPGWIECSDDAIAVVDIFNRFSAKHGRMPRSFTELVDLGYLRETNETNGGYMVARLPGPVDSRFEALQCEGRILRNLRDLDIVWGIRACDIMQSGKDVVLRTAPDKPVVLVSCNHILARLLDYRGYEEMSRSLLLQMLRNENVTQDE